MTGFGKSVDEKTPWGRLTVEVQSVNRRYWELSISVPRQFTLFEAEIRKQVAECVGRGQVAVRLFCTPVGGGIGRGWVPDVALLRAWKEEWEEIAGELGYGAKSIDLPFLMERLPEIAEEALAMEEEWPIVSRVLAGALEGLLEMKRREGEALERDIVQRLGELERHVVAIGRLSPQASEKMRRKLQERLGELSLLGEGVEERLLREIAIFSEKVDVAEEITRLHSHFAQCRKLFKSQSAVGKTLDFLIQEMVRECNTIGSKALDADIVHLVVECKGILEKMREQIQNVE
jgi:uncharacterized protein YicC (UPF0701 family)